MILESIQKINLKDIKAENVSLINLIDLKEVHECRAKINNKEHSIVSLLTNKDKQYIMLAGVYLIEIDNETFKRLNTVLNEHYRKHIFKK